MCSTHMKNVEQLLEMLKMLNKAFKMLDFFRAQQFAHVDFKLEFTPDDGVAPQNENACTALQLTPDDGVAPLKENAWTVHTR